MQTLFEFMSAFKHLHDVVPVKVTLDGKEYLQAVTYKQTQNPPDGAQNKEPYIQNGIYVVGSLPKAYLKRKKMCYTDPNGLDWYIACYIPEIKKGKQGEIDEKYKAQHPFGHTFVLMPWIVPGGEKIDQYETYQRFPITVTSVNA